MLAWEQVEALRGSSAPPSAGLGFIDALTGLVGGLLSFASDSGATAAVPRLLESDADRARLRAELTRAQAQEKATNRRRLAVGLGIAAAVGVAAFAWKRKKRRRRQ